MSEGDKFFTKGASKANDLALYVLTYPEQIKREQERILDLIEINEVNIAAIKDQNATFNIQIANNPSFKNSDQRNNELVAIQKASSTYQDMLTEQDESAENLAFAQISLTFLQNMFKAYLAIIGGQQQTV